ncbi:rRNA processing/ribosome biogenesis-domain-containing protein [Aspergillus egyptiacus]|nr:rRNA processing/ribosome biogenesis-domain-containing protein [Aspergillus egyptiacus]
MDHSLMSLRAVNHRLTSLPVQQLPPIAATLAASISECGELLSTPQSQKTGKTESDHAVQVHKLVTRLSSLLQDRTCEGRWAAVVLVKALVEAGQWEILRGSEPFVRGLMGILNKSDPVSTKVMSVITLTRIFHLTYQYPTLVREITTPSMPGFITSTLNLVSVKPSSEPTRRLKPNTPFLDVVLRAYAELIARHPTIFRPFTSQIHSVLQGIVGSTSALYPQPVVDIAEQLFIALHHCAPKNTGGEEWKNACRMTMSSIHTTADHVLRAVVEQWESVDPSLRSQLGHSIDYAQEVGSRGADALGLSGWQGLDVGVNRLLALLQMLSNFLTTATSSTVCIPVGAILDLTARLMSVTVPSDAGSVQANPQISRRERENLFAELPRIHAACIKVLQTLVDTLETAALPVVQTILEQTLWVFRAERFNRRIRTSVYSLINTLLEYMGPSMNKKSVSSLTYIIRTCCSDILPPEGEKEPSSDVKNKSKTSGGIVNADFFLNPNLKQSRQTNASARFPKLGRAASSLLSTVLTSLPTEFLAPPIRAEIDRTIIMTSEKNAMYASVLNPFPAVKGRGANISIIPFLARSYMSDMDVEALIRPRMPVLASSHNVGHYANMDEDDEDEMQPEPISASSQPVPEDTGFLKPSTTPNLQDLVDSTLPSNKRNYAQEPAVQSSVPSSVPQPAEEVQFKKARFEKISTTSSIEQPSVVSAATSMKSTSTFTPEAPLSAASVQDDSPMLDATASGSTSIIVEQASSVSQTGATAPPEEEDSDDEMPTLNLEPDTDEEEDE